MTTLVVIDDNAVGRGRVLNILSASAMRARTTLGVNCFADSGAFSVSLAVSLDCASSFDLDSTTGVSTSDVVVTTRCLDSEGAAGFLDCAWIALAEKTARPDSAIKAKTLFIKYHYYCEGFRPKPAAGLRFADGTLGCQQLF